MICFGQVRHRFHGDYSFVCALVFASTEDATKALPLFPGFQVQDKSLIRLTQGRRASDPHDKRTDVDDVKALVEKWRIYPGKAHRGEIDGTPFSIDYGPLFHLDLTQALIDHADSLKQLPLF